MATKLKVVEDVADIVPAPQIPDFDPATTRKRHAGWTAERQRRFIERLALTGSAGQACAAAGVASSSAYRLRNRAGAESFARAWDAALVLATTRGTAIAWDRALNGRAGACHCDFRMRFEKVELLGDAGRARDIVAVEPGDVASARMIERIVARRGYAAVGPLRDDPDARVVERADHVQRMIGRSVVDDDELQVLIRLIEDAADRLADELRAVIDRQQDGNGRGQRHFPIGLAGEPPGQALWTAE